MLTQISLNLVETQLGTATIDFYCNSSKLSGEIHNATV